MSDIQYPVAVACVGLLALLLFINPTRGQDEDKSFSLSSLSFFRELSQADPITRDEYMEGLANRVIRADGEVVSRQENGRYQKQYLIRVRDLHTDALNLSVTYNIFLDNRDTYRLAEKGTKFEFTGQVVGYTPLNSRRSAYILDIMLQQGAVLVE